MTAPSLNQEWFDAAVATLPAGALSPVRTQAAKIFSAEGFPSVRHEDWKYTNLSPAASVSNAWLREYSAARAKDSGQDNTGNTDTAVLDEIDAHWLIIRNGVLDSASLQELQPEDGLTISRLSDDDQLPQIAVDTPLSAFNAALLEDGVRVRIGAGITIAKPLGILLIDDPSQQVSQSRVVIEAAENSAARIIEYATSNMQGDQYSNSVVQVDIAAGAQVDHVRLQQRELQHIGTNRLIAELHENATFNHFGIDVGGSLSRNDLVIGLNGTGADVSLQGLYLATGQQHIDNHTRVEHRVGPTTSHEAYRGILGGQSRCVFNGQAIVFAGADGTDANQENHNLLLSDRAEIDTKPELEIYADDVKCSHGATVGQLDEKALFYLRSRGLGTDEARQLLTKAFAAHVVSKLNIEEARELIQAAVDQSLANILREISA